MASLWLKWVQYICYIVDIELVDGLVLSVLWLSPKHGTILLDKLIVNNYPSLNGKIDIHDSQCNLRYKANNILKIFCRINPLGQVVNTVKWHWRHSVFNHGHLGCLSNRLFRQTTKQTQKPASLIFLWQPPVTAGFSSQIGRQCGNRHCYYDSYSTLCGAIWRYKSVNTDSVMACCLTEPNHYLSQCWLIIEKVL